MVYVIQVEQDQGGTEFRPGFIIRKAQDSLCNEHLFVSSQDIPFSRFIICWATDKTSLVIKRIASYTVSLNSLTNLNWNAVAALQTGSLSCPASGAVFAGFEAAVALSSCLFLRPVLRIYQRLAISRCKISRFVQFPLFSDVFSSTFLPLSNSSLCGWIDKVPSRLSAFSSYSWSFTCHSPSRGILVQVPAS
jgi:hypothetical protein